MHIVDAHLDLAYNALRGRDVTLPAARQSADDEGIPSVGLPDLAAGGVGLICATLFCEPASDTGPGSAMGGAAPGYRTADQARAQAHRQLQYYYKLATDGLLEIVTSRAQLAAPAGQGDGAPGGTPKLRAIILMEGADALRTPGDVAEWFDAGLRIVGLAWKRTRMAGGTGQPGPLTDEGRALVRELDRLEIIHDASHLAEESFWQLMEHSGGPVIASHSNCRAIVPTDRQLTDAMARAIAGRGGVIGINFYDKFLLPPAEYKTRRATCADVIAHVRHFCDVTGSTAHVGIGTDMDGGFGAERIPAEIKSSADLGKLADALSAADFSDADVRGIMGENWLRFFGEKLAG